MSHQQHIIHEDYSRKTAYAIADPKPLLRCVADFHVAFIVRACSANPNLGQLFFGWHRHADKKNVAHEFWSNVVVDDEQNLTKTLLTTEFHFGRWTLLAKKSR